MAKYSDGLRRLQIGISKNVQLNIFPVREPTTTKRIALHSRLQPNYTKLCWKVALVPLQKLNQLHDFQTFATEFYF